MNCTTETERTRLEEVWLYVDRNLNYKVANEMTTAIGNVLECLTVEFSMENKKNVIVSCIYRAPGSNIDICKEWMEKIYTMSKQKVIFICGDFNIDLLNPNNHKPTEDFINTMYSLSLYPKITRPSRITSHCATLIDNIFTDVIDNNTISGLMINDISDHLPVFLVYNNNYKREKRESAFKYRRVRTDEAINALKNELLNQNWELLYKEENIDKGYEIFLGIFKLLYDKYCRIKEIKMKFKYSDSPWITKGLQNACKKKNTLYKEFIKLRTKDAENKYKKYKNKFTNIMRISKKEYYRKLIDNNKNNIKGLWNILNNVIGNGSRQVNYPHEFIENDMTIDNMDDAVNGFNQYFVNVGRILAEKIPVPVRSDDSNYDFIEINPK